MKHLRIVFVYILFPFQMCFAQGFKIKGEKMEAGFVYLSVDTLYQTSVSSDGSFIIKVLDRGNHKAKLFFTKNEIKDTNYFSKKIADLSFILDSPEILVTRDKDGVIRVKIESENSVKAAFYEIEKEYLKEISAFGINRDSIDKLKYFKEITLINSLNEPSDYAISKLISLMRPSAENIKNEIEQAIRNIEELTSNQTQKLSVKARYDNFLKAISPDKTNYFPEVEMISFDGSTVFSSLKQKTKYILVDFWATWCGPCIKQHPHINDLAKKTDKAKLYIIGIAASSPSDIWKKYLSTHNFVYPNFRLDSEKEQHKFNAFNLNRVPRYVLFRASDNFILESDISFKEIEKVIEKYVSE